MAEEKILYDFQGNATSLLNAAQQAIDALERVDATANTLASSNPFTALVNATDKLAGQLTTLKAAQQAFSEGISSVRSTSESLKGSLGGTASTIAATAMQMKSAYDAGYAFSGSNNALKSTLSGVATATQALGNQINSSYSQNLQMAINNVKGFSDYMQKAHSYASMFTQGMQPAARALAYVSSMAIAGQRAFTQFISPIIQTRKGMSDTGKASDDASGQLKKVNSQIKNTGTNSSNSSKKVTSLSGSFNSLQKIASTTAKALSSTFKGLTNTISSLSGSLGILASGLSLGNILGEAINKSNEYIETLNLFKVAAQKMLPEMQANIDVLEYYGGLAPATLMNAAGTFKILATEMGVTEKNASLMSNSLVNVSTDLASLFNQDFKTVMEDLDSALQGMTKSVRKYGIDISEAALAETAASLGISQSVETMSQAQKMQLRYINIIKQSSLAQTDFARTIQSPANMLKILKEQTIECARAIGNVLQPILKSILPVLIKAALVIQTVSKSLAALVGYDPKENAPDEDAYIKASDGAEKLAENTDKAAKKQKKLNNLLGGFDELHTLQDPSTSTDSSSGSSGTSGSSDLGIELPTYDNLLALTDFMPKLREEADGFAQSIIAWGKPIVTAFETVKSAWAPVRSLLAEASNILLPAIATSISTIITTGLFPFLSSIGGSLAQIIPSFSQFALSILPSVSTAFSTLLQSLGTVSTVFGEMISGILPSLTTLGISVLENFITPLSQAIGVIASGVGPRLEGFFTNLNTTLAPLVGSLGPALVDLFTSLATGSSSLLISTLSSLVTNVLPPLINFITDLVTTITPMIDTLLPVITQALLSIMPVLGSIVEAILPPLLSLFQLLVTTLTPLIVEIVPLFVDLFNEVGSLLADLITQVMPPLIDMFKELIEPTSEIIQAILPILIDCIKRLLEATLPLLSNVLPPLIKAFTALIPPIMQIIQQCIVPLVDIIITALTPILEVVINVIEILLSVLLPIIQVIINIIDFALQPFIVALGIVIDVVKTVLDVVVNVFNSIKDWIMGTIRAVIDIFDNVVSVFQDFINFIRDKLWGTVYTVFTKIGDFIQKVFQGVINGIIWVVNKFIDGLNVIIKGILTPFNLLIDAMNKIPGVDIPSISLKIPEIPKLAVGGVVTGPTPAIIGEGRYDEAVIPLGNSPQMRDLVEKIAKEVSQKNSNNDPNSKWVVQVFIGNEELDNYMYKIERQRELQRNGG